MHTDPRDFKYRWLITYTSTFFLREQNDSFLLTLPCLLPFPIPFGWEYIESTSSWLLRNKDAFLLVLRSYELHYLRKSKLRAWDWVWTLRYFSNLGNTYLLQGFTGIRISNTKKWKAKYFWAEWPIGINASFNTGISKGSSSSQRLITLRKLKQKHTNVPYFYDYQTTAYNKSSH